jgi:hypothetical protein
VFIVTQFENHNSKINKVKFGRTVIYPLKDEAQTALFKDPVRTAQ